MKSQQTGQQLARWGENLAAPQDETADLGARGPFDGKAHDRGPWSWFARHRGAVLAGAAGAVLTGAAAVMGRR